MKIQTIILIASISILSVVSNAETSEGKIWGEIQRIEFEKNELPPSLFNMFTGKQGNAFMQYCLPENYSRTNDYPLVVYIPGFHGHQGGNIKNAKDIANSHACVVATLPLFKANVDRSEVANGIIVSLSDYPVLSDAYKIMLKRLFEIIPNIDHKKSAMVGFSNGALTIAVLVSSNDEYILEHFHSFCLIDHGMFHLTDLHKAPTKNRRFLILVGDKEDMGRELKIRGAKLVEDAYQLLGINIESRVLEDTGHELTDACKKDIGAWIFETNIQ